VIGETVAVLAAASVEAAGGNRALAQRVQTFIEQQAERIGGQAGMTDA
jgi:serine/threonine-protein kinase HipA